MGRRKRKIGEEFFTLVFVRHEEERYHVVTKKHLKTPKATVRVGKDKSFVVQYDAPTLVHGLERQYVIDWESGNQYLLGEGETNPLTPEELDVILGTKIVKEITSSVSKDVWAMIIPLLIGALVGFLAAWIIASTMYQAKIDELMELIVESSITPGPDLWVRMILGGIMT
jgi:hypothetical protein